MSCLAIDSEVTNIIIDYAAPEARIECKLQYNGMH